MKQIACKRWLEGASVVRNGRNKRRLLQESILSNHTLRLPLPVVEKYSRIPLVVQLVAEDAVAGAGGGQVVGVENPISAVGVGHAALVYRSNAAVPAVVNVLERCLEGREGEEKRRKCVKAKKKRSAWVPASCWACVMPCVGRKDAQNE